MMYGISIKSFSSILVTHRIQKRSGNTSLFCGRENGRCPAWCHPTWASTSTEKKNMRKRKRKRKTKRKRRSTRKREANNGKRAERVGLGVNMLRLTSSEQLESENNQRTVKTAKRNGAFISLLK